MNLTPGYRSTLAVRACAPRAWLLAVILVVAGTAGCKSGGPRWVEQPWTPVNYVRQSSTGPSSFQYAATGAGTTGHTVAAEGVETSARKSPASPQQTVRAQDGGYGSTPRYPLSGQPGGYVPPAGDGTFAPGTFVQPAPVQGGYPLYGQSGPGFPQQTFQPPTIQTGQIGSPNETPPFVTGPTNFADIDVLVREAQTGRITFGAAYNSNSGLVGQIIVDERNFDIANYPRSLEDVINGTAWRGAGQGFRLELVPGNEVQRYAVSFDEPYLFNSAISFSTSGYFFDRRYFDWDEQRLGGRVALGYRLTPDLSISVGLRLENVNIHDPRVATSPSLNAVVGDNALYLGSVSLINDTRDHPFMASEGTYMELSFHQGFGDFGFPRGDVDLRRHFLIYQRPDGSGRHTLSLQSRAGFSGTSTPLFENYFAGGFSTLRGFAFRGASPVEGGVRVGGRFQFLNTVEYTFPITSDDMFKGVLFCDFGTVERDVTIKKENFRVAPGAGLRIHLPIGGAGGAPLAFDFAFPISDAESDDQQVFSFYTGILR